MKKLALTLIASLVGIQASFAAEPGFIVTKKGKKVQTTSIVADDAGNLTFSKGKVKSKVKRSDYKYAWLPKSSTVLRKIDKAAKKGASQKVADLYLKYANKYKFVGWDIYCKYKAAECLDKIDQTDKAIAVLEPIKGTKVRNPLKKPHYQRAMAVLAKLYTKKGENDKAAELIPELIKAKDGEIAGRALVVQGDMLSGQGKDKDAVLSYLQTVLLFPKTNGSRAEALYKTVITMNKMKDSGRAKKFIEMLKTDYPNSEFSKKL